LKTEELSFSIKPSPKKSLGIGGVGKLTMSLGELAKPLRLSGTLRNPSLSLDPTQTAITLGKAIGGIVLFGPVGIAAALAGGSFGDEENPCLCAIDKAKEGVGIPDDDAERENGKDGIVKDIEKAIGGIGDTFKKIFGK